MTSNHLILFYQAMPPPPIRPPMWNQQPQIPGTDLPPAPPGSGNSYPPPPPPGTSVSIFNTNQELCFMNFKENQFDYNRDRKK